MEVNIIRSSRKTIAIIINPDMSITVRAPRRVSKKYIDELLKDKEAWIQKHISKMEASRPQRENEQIEVLTNDEIHKLTDEASIYIKERVEYFAGIMNVKYNRVMIRNQRTRWGSCSSKGNLNFNCMLMLTPSQIIDYVVVHELCHLKEMNHSKAFWSEVEKTLPEYKTYIKWLKSEGSQIMKRNGRVSQS